MRRLLAGLVILACAATVAFAAGPKSRSKPPAPQMASSQDILRWINTYRANPEPHKLPAAVQAMSRLALFKELDSAGVYVGFTAGVLGANPALAEKLVTGMFPIPPEDQVVIVRAIAYSGLSDWKELLGKFVERMPARKVLIEHHLYGKGKTLMELPLDTTPAALDTLWGYYFATGSVDHVGRILTTLPWSKDPNDVSIRASAIQSMMFERSATRLPNVVRLSARLQKQLERPFGHPDRPHAVMDPARAEAGLEDGEAVTLVGDQVRPPGPGSSSKANSTSPSPGPCSRARGSARTTVRPGVPIGTRI